MAETWVFTNALLFFPKLDQWIVLLLKFEEQARIFLKTFNIIVNYYWFYFKGTIMLIKNEPKISHIVTTFSSQNAFSSKMLAYNHTKTLENVRDKLLF